jgi:hypothetical protein
MPAASAFIVMPEMFPTLPFDITRDFARIGFVAEQPFVIAVLPSLGTNSLAEFVALSKKKAGEINYAANSRGTLPHLTAERFRAATGADLTFIPYPGAAAGMQDVVGGRVSMIVEGLGTLMGGIQSGTLKPLAVTSLQRLPNFSDLPTVAETVPGFIATGWFALLAPAGTPEPIIRQVSRGLRKKRNRVASLDDLVGAGERHGKAQCLGSLKIDGQLVLVWRLHREIARLLALEDAVDVASRPPHLLQKIIAIRGQAAAGDEATPEIDGRQFVLGRKRDDQFAMGH